MFVECRKTIEWSLMCKMTVESESKISGMHKKRRMEIGCAIMTVDSESQVCGMCKESRVDLGCALMILKSGNKVCGMPEREEWKLDVPQ